jgi:hypothetical protein
MEGMTTAQINAHQKVERLIAKELPDKLLQRQAWEEVKRLSQADETKHMQIEDGVAAACRKVKAAVENAIKTTGGNRDSSDDNSTEAHVERDITRRRPAIRVRHESNEDSSPAEESPEEYSQIIATLAKSRGQQRPRVHRFSSGRSEE